MFFAACWAGMPIKAFAKIATPRFFRKNNQCQWFSSFINIVTDNSGAGIESINMLVMSAAGSASFIETCPIQYLHNLIE
ncbi:hypothetical protein ABXJ76_15320 [Methylobacter sp. G7]|uniref:hypothetical protein n=1 Tax=Methylobacter sp. G7 TaxID=3230117 RepID=UPI003D809A92